MVSNSARRSPIVAGKFHTRRMADGSLVRLRLTQAQERTEFLIENLGGGTNLASLLKVSKSQPTQWRKGTESPSPDVARTLVDLDHVVARASLLWDGESVRTWLTSSNVFLDGATPLDVLQVRGSRDVIDALDAEQAGSYA